MNKRVLIGAVIGLIIIIFGAIFFVYGKSRIWVSKLNISEKTWDFGTVKKGSELKHTFIIKNTGSAELTVYAYSSCPACLLLQFDTYNIPPKSETKMLAKVIEVEEGPYEGYALLESNDPAHRTMKIKIKGKIIQ